MASVQLPQSSSFTFQQDGGPVRITLPTARPEQLAEDLKGYSWLDADLRWVGSRAGITDGRALLLATKKFDNGDKKLSRAELILGAHHVASPSVAQLRGRPNKWLKGFHFDPGEVDRIARRFGLANVPKLLKTAIASVGGRRSGRLTRRELLAAAHKIRYPSAPAATSSGGLTPNHLAGVYDAIAKLDLAQTTVRTLDTPMVDGISRPVKSYTFPFKGALRRRVMLTAGVHGNEPAGVGAAVKLMERLASGGALADGIEFTIVPLVNPESYGDGTRRTRGNLDLNRTFDPKLPGPHQGLVKNLEGLFDELKPDLLIDLHGAGAKRTGFFGIIDPKDTKALRWSREAMARLKTRRPVMGWTVSSYDRLAAGVYKSDNAGTLKALALSRGVSAVTTEAPASLSYEHRVAGNLDMVTAYVTSLNSQYLA